MTFDFGGFDFYIIRGFRRILVMSRIDRSTELDTKTVHYAAVPAVALKPQAQSPSFQSPEP